MGAPVVRLRDWAPRLLAYIQRSRSRSFAYGHLDCALFAAGAVEAMTGVDHAARYRPYTSLADGLKLLRAEGYADHVAPFRELLPAISVARARHGDLAVIDGPIGRSLGVIQGASIYALTETETALALVPLSEAREVLKV